MEDFFTTATRAENGRTIIVTGRRDVEKFRSKPKYGVRVEVTLPYKGDSLGFPGHDDSQTIEQVTDAFNKALKGKNTAILTGIYTGDDERNWVFHTINTDIFTKFINTALAHLPPLPLKLYAENDPDWAEYDEMMSVAPAPDDEDIIDDED